MMNDAMGFSPVFFSMSILVLLFVASLLLLWRYLRINLFNPAGKGAEKQTRAILKKFAGIRGFRVLSGLTLQSDGKSAHVENLLIGYFGLLLVHTCGARGHYYGALDSENWSLAQGQGDGAAPVSKTSFPNPILEQRRAISMLRDLFSRAQLYKIPIENVVYVSNKSSKTGVYITNAGEILPPRKLSAYLRKEKFGKDLGLDVSKIADLISEYASSSDQTRH